jgi:hypothetical protein
MIEVIVDIDAEPIARLDQRVAQERSAFLDPVIARNVERNADVFDAPAGGHVVAAPDRLRPMDQPFGRHSM